MTLENSSAFLFDDLRVERAMFRAFKAGNAIQLEPKAFRLLLFLIENRGRLIEKDEILQVVWNGAHVTENALASEIAKLRNALGDDSKTPRYIETVRTRGYRFIAEVREQNGSEETRSQSFNCRSNRCQSQAVRTEQFSRLPYIRWRQSWGNTDEMKFKLA